MFHADIQGVGSEAGVGCLTAQHPGAPRRGQVNISQIAKGPGITMRNIPKKIHDFEAKQLEATPLLEIIAMITPIMSLATCAAGAPGSQD